MNAAAKRVVRTYVSLTLLSTFASSFIWGINTLFLLDAGLTITGAFTANAFFTAGQVVFEIPTGVIADTRGRRTSFLLGTATLFVTTLAYLWLWQITGPFWAWALVSALLGLGFTFFSGATEAWLVDGLKAAKYDGQLDGVFAKGSIATGIAMLTGTVAGGLVAQYSNVGVPYIMRIVALGLTFLIAFFLMRDEGFSAKSKTGLINEMKDVVAESVEFGLRNKPVRWMMLSSLFSGGVAIFAFYAMQPYLLQLYGRSGGFLIAGIAAAIVAGAQIAGGFLVPFAGKLFKRRTSLLMAGSIISTVALMVIAFAGNFWIALAMLAIWAVIFAAIGPVRQSYMNGIIPSAQRATVLSADNMMSSAGGVISQPALGKVAEVWGYPASYFGSAVYQILALPLIAMARREKAKSDKILSEKLGQEPAK